MTDPPSPPPPDRRSSLIEIAVCLTPILILTLWVVCFGNGDLYDDLLKKYAVPPPPVVVWIAGSIGLSILSLAAYATLYTLAVTGYAWVVAVIVMIVLGWAFGDYLPRGFLIGAAITAPVAFFVGRAIEKEDAQQRANRDE